MTKHKITIEQTRFVQVDIEADTYEQAEALAHQTAPDCTEAINKADTRFVGGTARILPPTSKFDVDKEFKTPEEALDYLRGQRDPFDCLFRYLKHHSYWGQQDFCASMLAAATDIIKAQEGHGY